MKYRPLVAAFLAVCILLIVHTVAVNEIVKTAAPQLIPPWPELPPYSLMEPGWERLVLKTVCLQVQSSVSSENPIVLEQVAATLRWVLARWHIQAVLPGDPCDATLLVSLSGRTEATGSKFLVDRQTNQEVPGSRTFCTAAYASGTLALTVADRSLTQSLEGKREACGYSPSMDDAWTAALAQGIEALWGKSALVPLIDSDLFGVSTPTRDVSKTPG